MNKLSGVAGMAAMIALALSASATAGADSIADWHTFPGGKAEDQTNAMAVDGTGNVYVAGFSRAAWCTPYGGADCPYAPPKRFPTENPSETKEAFVAMLHADGTVAWHTFLGGKYQDEARGIAVDGDGNSYVVGFKEGPSWDALVCPPSPASYPDQNGWVAKLDSSGNCVWRTFVGSEGTAVAVDGDGNLYVAGRMGAAFLAKLDPETGGVLWGPKAVAGNENGIAKAVAIGDDGVAYVTGVKECAIGSTGGMQKQPFAGKISADGATVAYGCIGYPGKVSPGDEGTAIAVDAGVAYVAGDSDLRAFVAKVTWEGGVPTVKGAWNPRPSVDPGGGDQDNARSIALRRRNDGVDLYVAGDTHDCNGMPVSECSTWGPSPTGETDRIGKVDAWVAKLDPSGADDTWLEARRFLGGTENEYGVGVGLDASGAVYLAGYAPASWTSFSSDPVIPHDPDGSWDLVVVRLGAAALCPPEDACDTAGCLATRTVAWGTYDACVHAAVAKHYLSGQPIDAELKACRETYFGVWKRCFGDRFTVTDDGETVTDNLSGLVWERKTGKDGKIDESDAHDADNVYTWSSPAGPWTESGTAFTTFLETLNGGTGFAESHGWRMPTLAELHTLMTVDVKPSAAFPEFADTAAGFYWSATSALRIEGNCTSTATCAWNIMFTPPLKLKPPEGTVAIDGKDGGRHVRAVRGGL